MFRRGTSSRLQAGEDRGFTLIELLVVITILGILAAIVVFAVQGIGDKGKGNAIATDAAVLRTAEEAYCAKNGSYADIGNSTTPGTLVGDKFLATPPSYNGVVVYAGGKCGTGSASAFTVGSGGYVTPAGGTRILVAANNTPGFSFMGAEFNNANSPVTFKFGASGGDLTTAANDTADSSTAFFSADESNITSKLTAAQSPPAEGASGTCTVAAGNPCLVIGSTKHVYAVGKLVVFSCKAGGQTLAPAKGAPTCKTSSAPPPATSTADLVAKMAASSTLKLTIASPVGSGSVPSFVSGGCADPAVVNAPYGLAAYKALNAAGMTCAQFGTYVTSSRIVLGSNVTTTQDNVVTGAADYAIIPKSFVVSPAGNDTDNWVNVAPSEYAPFEIKQYAAVLDRDGSGTVNTPAEVAGKAFLDYVLSPVGQAVLAGYGYCPTTGTCT